LVGVAEAEKTPLSRQHRLKREPTLEGKLKFGNLFLFCFLQYLDPKDYPTYLMAVETPLA
jgi:hypothetical protein